MDEREMFNDDYEKIEEMDENFTPEEFAKMCLKYSDKSIAPYSLLCAIMDDGSSREEYYMQMLMDVYSHYTVGENFLEMLQLLIKCGDCIESQKKAHEIIKDRIQDGYVIAYRGEFAGAGQANLDYKQSVSYTLDYEQAKFFATRFSELFTLTKSIVYTVKVPVNDILAHIERENEIVCLPVCMGGKMEVIKEESFL